MKFSLQISTSTLVSSGQLGSLTAVVVVPGFKDETTLLHVVALLAHGCYVF